MNDEMHAGQIDAGQIGVIVVDHGSRREQSNNTLLELVEQFREGARYAIVEPAHMELADPTIPMAFDRCVAQGAELVVVYPYFLLPGRHWHQDIPALAAEAAARHPGVPYLVAAPLGLHPLLTRIIDDRIRHCLQHARYGGESCPMCDDTEHCRMHAESPRADTTD